MSDQVPENEKLLNFLASTVELIRERMATKDDVVRLGADMMRMEERLTTQITAVRGDVERVDLRIVGVERTLASRLD
jgi:hypothetical protein